MGGRETVLVGLVVRRVSERGEVIWAEDGRQ